MIDPRARNPALVGLLAFVASTCSSESSTKAVSSTVRDSAGVRIVESRRPEWGEGQDRLIGAVLTRFEGGDVAGVIGAVRLPDGTTVAAEESGPRLLFFDPAGRVKASIGRRGDGPGEFRLPQLLGHRGDTVWVYDYVHSRVTRFDADGVLLGIVNLTPPLPTGVAVGDLPDGSLVLMGQWQSNRARNAQGLMRDSVAVIRYANGQRQDTIAVVPGREFMQHADATGRMVMSAAPLGRRASATTWNDAIVVGSQDHHSLRVLGTDGRGERIIRWRGPDLALSRQDVEEWIHDRVASAPAEQRAELRAMLENSAVPKSRPAYGRMLVSADGELWVSGYEPPDAASASWDVFTRDGTWLGTVRNPERLRLLDVGHDWLLAIQVDSLGVEQLQLRQLGPG